MLLCFRNFLLLLVLSSFLWCDFSERFDWCFSRSGLLDFELLSCWRKRGKRESAACLQDLILTEEEVSRRLKDLVSKSLKPVRNATAENIRQRLEGFFKRETYAAAPAGARKVDGCIKWVIRNQTVSVSLPRSTETALHTTKPFWNSRLLWTRELFRSVDLPNRSFEIAQCLHDCVQTVRSDSQLSKMPRYREPAPVPVFSVIQCQDFSDDIACPVFEAGRPDSRTLFASGLDDWDVACALHASLALPWSRRKSKAVFRGSARESLESTRYSDSCEPNKRKSDGQPCLYGRSALAYQASRHPSILDVVVTESRLRRSSESFMSVRKLSDYKYAIYAEGNCGWADRLWWQMHTPQVVIKQQSPCGLFFEELMQPSVDHVLCASDFRDLARQVKWLIRRDREARFIATNAMRFAEAFLVRRSLLEYFEALMKHYSEVWR
jgi:hypothetical protein